MQPDFSLVRSLHQGKEMNNQPIMQCEKSLQCFSALIIRIQWFIIIKIPVLPNVILIRHPGSV
jgi:hypothetical protein